MLLYSVPKSLNVWVETELPKSEEKILTHFKGNKEHGRLMGAEQHYRRIYQEQYPSKSGLENIQHANIVTASLTIFYSRESQRDTNPDTQYDQMTIDIVNLNHSNRRSIFTSDTFDPKYDYTAEIFNKNGARSLKKSTVRNTHFINHIQRRIDSVLSFNVQFNYGNAILNVHEFSSNPQFPEAFAHGEQGLVETILQEININFILDSFRGIQVRQIVAIILNAHTSRPMCTNCNMTICGCQSDGQNSILNNILTRYQAGLRDRDVRVRFPKNGVHMHSLISCSLPSNKEYHHTLMADKHTGNNLVMLNDHNPHLVLQKFAKNTLIEEHSLKYNAQNYQGDYFVCKKIPAGRVDRVLFSL